MVPNSLRVHSRNTEPWTLFCHSFRVFPPFSGHLSCWIFEIYCLISDLIGWILRQRMPWLVKNIFHLVVMDKDLLPKGLFIWRRASPLTGLEVLLRSRLIPVSHSKFVVCSYEQAGWPARRDLTEVLPRSCSAGWKFSHMSTPVRWPRQKCVYRAWVKKQNFTQNGGHR